MQRQHTLTHCLNGLHKNKSGEESQFANLGVDGIRPIAMWGLVKYYGSAIKDTRVILHFNPLWMSSPQHDLQGEEEFRFNHPRLVPQVYPDLACYNPSLNDIVSVAAERHVSFFSLLNHIKAVSFENMNLQDWTVMYPYRNPLSAIALEAPAPGEQARQREANWKQRRIAIQNFRWMQPEESRQWKACTSLIELLRAKQNSVFVLLGPFNPYVLTEQSAAKYSRIRKTMEDYLASEDVAHYSAPQLPSEHYADASHPLKEGYAQMADAVWASESFQKWLGRSEAEHGER